ncbi:MAG: hypothetical protein AAF702_32230 [Chloroflexota bacterium]
MTNHSTSSTDSIVVLYKGGRLPTWQKLPPAERQAIEQQHVELMLATARQTNLMRLEGFRLLTPERDFVRFWAIEFPTLTGAEVWIEAEMAPPYGAYGYYEYMLARSWAVDQFKHLVTNPLPPVIPQAADPHQIPQLDVDANTIVVLLFERWQPEAAMLTPQERGERELSMLRQSIAEEHGLHRLEAFRLIGMQAAWRRLWIAEFPTLAGAESWIQAEVGLPHGIYADKTFYLARKWAPAYFASWVLYGENK